MDGAFHEANVAPVDALRGGMTGVGGPRSFVVWVFRQRLVSRTNGMPRARIRGEAARVVDARRTGLPEGLPPTARRTLSEVDAQCEAR